MNGAALASIALLQLIMGPMPEEGKTLIAQLCNGAQIEIPLGDGDEKRGRDCHQKACHAGTCRKKAKRPV